MTRQRPESTPASVGTSAIVARSNSIRLDEAERIALAEGITGRYGLCPVDILLENPNAVTTHSKRQIRKIARSMDVAGPLSPLVIDETYTVLAGHARLAAERERGSKVVPVVQVFGLTASKKRFYLLADNRLGKDAGLDRQKLAKQLPELQVLFAEADIELTDAGYEVAELDALLIDMEDELGGEDEGLNAEQLEEPCGLEAADLLQLGNHRLLVGDARDPAALNDLMQGDKASCAFLDPPYNVSARAIGGRGRIRHADFQFAFGEMDRSQYVSFLVESCHAVAGRCQPGSVVFVCSDAHHVRDMIEAGESVFQAYLTLVVWNKTNAGQGGLYRSQYELIGVFRVGDEANLDNVQKGRFGRNRSNVWTYPGVNTFRAGRLEDLACHPTVKPTRMVADAIKDVTKQGGIILDTFVGSGTTILAAEQTGRCARAIELTPHYAQVAARRWEKLTGRDATHVASGCTLDELLQSRRQESGLAPRDRNMARPQATGSIPARVRIRTRQPA